MGKNSKRERYTRYASLTERTLVAQNVPGGMSNTRARNALWGHVDHMVASLMDDPVAYNSLPANVDIIFEEMLHQAAPDATTLYLRDPELVDVLEWSVWDDVRPEDICFPSDHILLNLPKGTYMGGSRISSVLLHRVRGERRDDDITAGRLAFAQPGADGKCDPSNPAGVSKEGFILTYCWDDDLPSCARYSFQTFLRELRGEPALEQDRTEEEHEPRRRRALIRFLAGLGVYLKSYPESVVAGLPDDAYDRGSELGMAPSSTIGMSAGLRAAVAARRQGFSHGIEPHMRRTHWRRLPDDPVRYPNKHGLFVPVKACVVGKVKTVTDITNPDDRED